MFEGDLMVILRVLERVEAHAIDPLDVIISLNRFGVLNRDVYISLLKEYTKTKHSIEERKKIFYALMFASWPLVSFDDFNRILKDAGYNYLSESIIEVRNGMLQNWPPKREMAHADAVNEYFANLKNYADNNAFHDGTRYRLETFISSFGEKLKHCKGNPGRYQLLVDKQIMTYFLLAQQFPSMCERLETMKRMRDSVPQNVDRTLFDTIFHSYMTVIRSIKDDAVSADNHEQKARYACQSCLPSLVSIVLRLCGQYKNNIFYFRRHHSDDMEHATVDFEEVFQMFDYIRNDPLYGTIAMLEMVHTLLGIDWDLNVCKMENINARNFERGKTILSTLRKRKPCQTRRKMLYYLCLARVHEKLDTREAEKYARKSLNLAEDGCYYDVEKTNIQNYLVTLAATEYPQPQI